MKSSALRRRERLDTIRRKSSALDERSLSPVMRTALDDMERQLSDDPDGFGPGLVDLAAIGFVPGFGEARR